MMENDILGRIWPEWAIVKEIGSGSFGTVYKAVRKEYGIESFSAIKLIRIGSDFPELKLSEEEYTSENTADFIRNVIDESVREIQIQQEFKGTQNIVSIEDYKVVEEKENQEWIICIRMELLTKFTDYAAEHTFTTEDIVKLGTDICSALELCERKNVIHRDIKPENIFLNAFGDFKLGDFGIARSLETLSENLSYRGTYNYMAPEVARCETCDKTSDYYALGLVLYRLVNKNRLPFLNIGKTLYTPSERAEASKRRIAGEELPLPCEAPEDLAKVILKACAPDRRDRFQTAAQMKAALLELTAEKNNAGRSSAQQNSFDLEAEIAVIAAELGLSEKGKQSFRKYVLNEYYKKTGNLQIEDGVLQDVKDQAELRHIIHKVFLKYNAFAEKMKQ